MEGVLRQINKKIKNKVNMFLHTILPDKIPEFSVSEVDEVIFFIYLNKNEIILISHLGDQEADEVIKVGVCDNEFVFYPARADSAFFNEQFELRTFAFIETILTNKINLIAQKIYQNITFLCDKILEYKMLYLAKLTNIEYEIDLDDRTKILCVNPNLYHHFDEALKDRLTNIAKTNLLDSPLHIFKLIFPSGICDIESFMSKKNVLEAGILKNYYNTSNLINPNTTLQLQISSNGKEIEFECMFEQLYLQVTPNGKFSAYGKIKLVSINALSLQPDTMLYSNNDLKVIFKKDYIELHNLSPENITINSLASIFVLQGINPFDIKLDNINIIIPPRNNINITLKKDHYFGAIKNLCEEKLHNQKIKHSIKLIYSSNKETRTLVGSSSYRLYDMFMQI